MSAMQNFFLQENCRENFLFHLYKTVANKNNLSNFCQKKFVFFKVSSGNIPLDG